MADAPRLTFALGDYPHTRPLKTRALADPAVRFDFPEVEPIHKAFAPMVRDAAYDLSELAIVTALQALEAGRPIALLPVVVAARRQRGCIIVRRDDTSLAPDTLKGRRVGVRAYTQTTGMWVRAALWEDAGLGVEDVTWITRDPAHVAEYRDPPFVRHDAGGKSLPRQLLNGDIDAAILGNDLPDDPAFRPLIPDHRAIDAAWVAHHGFVPINHMVAVRRDTLERHPQAVRAAHRLLAQGIAEQGAGTGAMAGVDALRAPLAAIIDECVRQRLLHRTLDVDAVLAPAADLIDREAGHPA